MTAQQAVLAIDIGGSGSRVSICRGDQQASSVLPGPRVSVQDSGSTVPDVIRACLRYAEGQWPEHVAELTGVGVGASGLASLIADPAALARSLRTELDRPVALAIDAVTAHLGALDGDGGAVVALGTGAIAISHPGPDAHGAYAARWRRADGWGHLLGDRGGGAWLGRNGLESALRAYDGVDPAGAALLAAGQERFGSPPSWPAAFYTRADRAGVLAEFARDVVDLAAAGDPAAAALAREAGREAARTGLAALEGQLDPQANGLRGEGQGGTGGARSSESSPGKMVLTGGLGRSGGILGAAFDDAVSAARDDDVVVCPPAGEPLDGARLLAGLAASGHVEAQDGFVWQQ